MEHGGKMKHRVFRKICAMCGSIFMSACPSLASVAWHNKIKLRDDHILNTTQKRNFAIFDHLMYEFAHVLWSTVSLQTAKLQNHGELLYRIIYLLYIFSHHFDLAKGDNVVDLTRYIETLYLG